MRLTFYGGTKTVTGSNYLLEHDGKKIIIDCGVFQGSNYVERQNFKPFPFDPKEISAAFITHAHIDHTGRLPKLIRDGFSGTLYSTEPTREFAQHLLKDSISIMSRESKRCKEIGFCLPENIEKLMQQWKGVPYHESFEHGPFTITFYNAGHILGSSFIEIRAGGITVVFSGDLGNSPVPLITPREPLERADYCLIESTYGNREHKARAKIRDELEDMIEDAARSGGTLMIPAFSMERTQILLYHINSLIEEGRIPKIPIFLDSPLAIRLTNVYEQFVDELDIKPEYIGNDGKLFEFPSLKKTLTTKESRSIASVKPPKVIIAGAGMSQGGRIIHHEKLYLPDPNSHILFVGYQIRGSLGRKILEGAKEVRIMKKTVQVRARVKEISGYSAHADKRQLLEWLTPARFSLKRVFVVQGEIEQSEPFARAVQDELAVDAVIPSYGETVELL